MNSALYMSLGTIMQRAEYQEYLLAGFRVPLGVLRRPPPDEVSKVRHPSDTAHCGHAAGLRGDRLALGIESVVAHCLRFSASACAAMKARTYRP